MIGLILVSCGPIGATRPFLTRPRVRLFVRRLAIPIGWIVIALYGLFLASVGLEMRG